PEIAKAPVDCPIKLTSQGEARVFLKYYVLSAAILTASASSAQENKPFDAAAAFGAREGVANMSLSPDGKSVAYVAAPAGPGCALLTLDLAEGSKAHVAPVASGKPERIRSC